MYPGPRNTVTGTQGLPSLSLAANSEVREHPEMRDHLHQNSTESSTEKKEQALVYLREGSWGRGEGEGKGMEDEGEER